MIPRELKSFAKDFLFGTRAILKDATTILKGI
jgi:hypothetical protein